MKPSWASFVRRTKHEILTARYASPEVRGARLISLQDHSHLVMPPVGVRQGFGPADPLSRYMLDGIGLKQDTRISSRSISTSRRRTDRRWCRTPAPLALWGSRIGWPVSGRLAKAHGAQASSLRNAGEIALIRAKPQFLTAVETIPAIATRTTLRCSLGS